MIITAIAGESTEFVSFWVDEASTRLAPGVSSIHSMETILGKVLPVPIENVEKVFRHRKFNIMLAVEYLGVENFELGEWQPGENEPTLSRTIRFDREMTALRVIKTTLEFKQMQTL